MLFKKMWRTMGLYKAQFISMIIMILLGTGIFVGFNMEWVSIDENMNAFFSETGYADFRIVSEKGFSSSDAEKIASISGVDEVSRYVSVNADVKGFDGDSVALTVTENEKVSGMYYVSGEKYDKDSKDGVWISDKYANANGIKEGDGITFTYKGIEISGTVKGFVKAGEYMICVRDESQLMPDFNTYGFAFISPVMYKEALKADFYPQINVISDLTKKDFTEEADKKLENTVMILTKDESAAYSAASGEITEGRTMGAIMPTIFLLIAVLTMVTTMHRLCAKEKTQIGTLKALGFKNRRILLHYTSYAFMIGVIGSALGIILGYAVAWYIMNPNGMMGTYMDLPYWKLNLPLFCCIVLLLIIAALTLIGFLSVKSMLAGTAADALRPYSPKKVKPMLIEKTKMFHKLSFGVRWNMRDILRHKSRTAMSLIGIIGCTLIVVAALGMRDTMDSFLNTYYNGALGYSSRIYISEDATDGDRKRLIEKYDGDTGATVSVQIEDKAVSLEIYDLKNNLVRFPDGKKGYAEIKSDGAYICQRIADEFKLKQGDTFVISPYGTDKEYTLKVAGVIRSVSESVVVNTEYADKAGIEYKTTSIFTKTEKADIASDSAIKSIQSKQMIIDSFDVFTQMLSSSVLLLVGGALLLGVVVLYNLGVMSYTERYREMATLKVVGFRDKKIGALLTQQNMWLTLTGVIIGIPAGAGALKYLLVSLAGEYEMTMVLGWKTYVISVALTFGMSLLVSFLVAGKNKKINMAEALKCAE